MSQFSGGKGELRYLKRHRVFSLPGKPNSLTLSSSPFCGYENPHIFPANPLATSSTTISLLTLSPAHWPLGSSWVSVCSHYRTFATWTPLSRDPSCLRCTAPLLLIGGIWALVLPLLEGPFLTTHPNWHPIPSLPLFIPCWPPAGFLHGGKSHWT